LIDKTNMYGVKKPAW